MWKQAGTLTSLMETRIEFEIFDMGIFMPPTHKGAGGIMFSGCPSVRTGIW